MEDQINWAESHQVFYNLDDGEYFVRVATGYIEMSDYTGDGGRVLAQFQIKGELVKLSRRYTNAEISNGTFENDPNTTTR